MESLLSVVNVFSSPCFEANQVLCLIRTQEGSLHGQAENGQSARTLIPDLDNANVGTLWTIPFYEAICNQVCRCGMPVFFFAWSGKCSTQEAVNRGHHLWPLYKTNADLPVEAGKGSNENSINNRGK